MQLFAYDYTVEHTKLNRIRHSPLKVRTVTAREKPLLIGVVDLFLVIEIL